MVVYLDIQSVMRYTLIVLFNLVVLFFCFVLNTVTAELGPHHGKVVACYWTTWSMYRPGKGKFQLENVNPTLCTHLILAFVLLDERDTSVKLIGNWKDLASDEQGQSNITKLKQKHPHLKVLVSIGGWQDGSIKYSKMAANAETRSSFVNNTIEFIRKNNLDGLDLFWEYPTKRGGSLHDKANLVHLIKELRLASDKHNLLLTAGLGASKDTIDNGYDVPQLSLYLDYMFMMCYDYSGWWSRIIGPNAPLHGPSLLNVEYTITYMLKLGADPEKLILGIPFYGRPFLRLDATTDLSSNASYLGQKFKNSTFNGPYTQEDGFMAYNEICLELSDRKSNWSIFWDDLSKTPYVVNGEKFISYDNHRSISEKIKFALNHELGGIMAWSIDTDDFRGDCNEVVNGQKNYPLLRAIDQEIHEFLEYQRQHPNSIKMDPRVSHVESSVASIASLNSFLFFVVFASYLCWSKP